MKIKVSRVMNRGLGSPVTESRVILVPDDSTIPNNGVRVDDSTPVSNWKEDKTATHALPGMGSRPIDPAHANNGGQEHDGGND